MKSEQEKELSQVLDHLKMRKPVLWGRLHPETIKGVLSIGAAEIGQPVSMWDDPDFQRPLTIINGRTLRGLKGHFRKKGQDSIALMFEQVGINVTAEDVIAHMREGRLPYWARVPIPEVRKLIDLVADELKRPTATLYGEDLSRPLGLLNGRSLGGLYQRLYKDPERRGREPISFLFEKLGISLTIQDIERLFKEGRKVMWTRVNSNELRVLLQKTADDQGVPIGALGQPEIVERQLPFLNNHTLGGLYGYFNKHPECKEKDTITFIFERAGVTMTAEDAIFQLRRNRPVFWNRASWEEVSRLIQMMASEIGVPVSMLAEPDFKRPLVVTDGRALSGLYSYAHDISEDTTKETTEFILEKVGVLASAEDAIRNLVVGRRVMWNRISWQEINNILDRVATEVGLPIYILGQVHLRPPLKFLESHGLLGLYSWSLAHPEKGENETAMQFIRRKCGLVEPIATRQLGFKGEYRGQQIQKSLTQFLQTFSMFEGITMENLMPWIKQVASVYKSSYLGISVYEVESEVVIYLAGKLQNGESLSRSVGGLHQHLEKFYREIIGKKYKEISLQTPIHEDLTLETVLEDMQQPYVSDDVSEQMQGLLVRLSPFQRNLVWGIVVDSKSFKQLSEETNIDIDTLQEFYDDALASLKQDFETTEGN